jgi:hypothetical protein
MKIVPVESNNEICCDICGEIDNNMVEMNTVVLLVDFYICDQCIDKAKSLMDEYLDTKASEYFRRKHTKIIWQLSK